TWRRNATSSIRNGGDGSWKTPARVARARRFGQTRVPRWHGLPPTDLPKSLAPSLKLGLAAYHPAFSHFLAGEFRNRSIRLVVHLSDVVWHIGNCDLAPLLCKFFL